MEHDRQIFCHFGLFLPFYPTNNQKNLHFEKMKESPRDIIILLLWTTNDNHMMCGSWDMEDDGHNFLSFWTIFCPFTPLTTWKIKILKIKNKAWIYHHFLQVYQKSSSYMLHCSWDMACDWCNSYFSFWATCCLFTPLTAWKIKFFKKMIKMHEDIIILHTCTIN